MKKTDFSKILEQSKFLFEWQDTRYDLDVKELSPQGLRFQQTLSLPIGKPPLLTISVMIGQKWREHYFAQTDWLLENGQIVGLKLLGPAEVIRELKKNLEIGLCV